LETGPKLEKTVGPLAHAGATHAASIESVSLRRIVGVARGPIGSNWSNWLKAGPGWRYKEKHPDPFVE